MIEGRESTEEVKGWALTKLKQISKPPSPHESGARKLLGDNARVKD